MYCALAIYLAAFVFAARYLDKKQKTKNTRAYFYLLLALVFRLFLAPITQGHSTDISCFKAWALRLAEVGGHNFYQPGYFADYPPGYMVVLYLLGTAAKLLRITGTPFFALLLKLIPILADIIIGLIIYRTAQKTMPEKNSAIPMLLFAFSPAIIINSALWGQIDSFFSLFILLSLLCVYNENYIPGAALYALSALIKPQAFIIAPIYLAVYLRTKSLKLIIKSAAAAAATVLIVSLPFTRGFDFTWLADKYIKTLSSYPYATVNAYNIYALMGYNWKSITAKLAIFPVSVWSNLVIAAVASGSIWLCLKVKKRDIVFYCAYLAVATLFTLGAKMHERYLYPALILLLLTYILNRDKRFLFLFIAQSAGHFLNVADILMQNINSSPHNATTPAVVAICAALFIASLAYSFYLAYDVYLKEIKAKKREMIYVDEKNKPNKAIILITLIYAAAAFAYLGDTKAPQTFWKENNRALIVLDKPGQISGIMMYLGIGKGKYTIETSIDAADWSVFAEQKHDLVFAWKRAKGNAAARYISISSDSGSFMLGEIGVIDKDGNLVKITRSTANELTDEQNIIPKRPTYLNGTYFDEVYHPRTAYEILHRMPPYETTHPPLGKLIISLGIMLFGMTPFGWRFMGTLAGVVMVPLFYLICKKIIKSRHIAGAAAVIFAFDFMHYTQTRLATIDSFAVLFVMLAYYFILPFCFCDFNKQPFKKSMLPLLLCGISFGLGAAVKWSCIYSAAGIGVILLSVWIRGFIKSSGFAGYPQKLAKSLLWCVVCFIALPAVIYFLSYLPQMRYDLNGRSPIEYVAHNQLGMYKYHSELKATHPYSSKWYEWIINKRPLWAYIDGEQKEQGIISSIASFGNPAVWWTGILAIPGCLYPGTFKKRREFLFPVIGYASMLAPWIFVSRTIFIYHYFPCVVFLCLAIACCMDYLYELRIIRKREIYGFCLVVLVLFVMFYPVLSGYGTTRQYVESYLKWLDTWTFYN
jgi:dolichyl-phosphate-mannose-protein mannosyltransferase